MAKFRFHWGWAIGLFYTIFVLVILGIVIKSFSVDNSLVVDDYYSYDIGYQEHADKLANTRLLLKDIEFDYNREEKLLKIKYPEGFSSYTGEIQFYKPDNKKLDFLLDVKPDENYIQEVNLKDIVGGYWRIKINWEGNGNAYYKEHSVYN